MITIALNYKREAELHNISEKAVGVSYISSVSKVLLKYGNTGNVYVQTWLIESQKFLSPFPSTLGIFPKFLSSMRNHICFP